MSKIDELLECLRDVLEEFPHLPVKHHLITDVPFSIRLSKFIGGDAVITIKIPANFNMKGGDVQ